MEQKTLKEIHEDVPPDYYDTGLKSNLVQRIYHSRRFSKICSMVSRANGSILDIGCDGGTLLEKVAERAGAKTVVGIDVSDEAVAYTLNKLPQFDVLVGDAEQLPFQESSFEAIFASEVLEHIHRPDLLFTEMRRCMTEDGYGLVVVPHETLLFKFLWFFWTRFGRGRVWHHAHVQEFGGDRLDRLMTDAGFRIVEDRYFLLGMLRAVKISPKDARQPAHE